MAFFDNVTRLSLIGLLAVAITACGGGSDSGPRSTPTPTPTPDVIPDDVTLVPVTGVLPGAEVVSPEVTISGIDATISLSVVNGEYSLNGGDFTSAEGTVENGNALIVRTTAADFGQSKEVELLINGVAVVFVVTTVEQDITPTAFSFAPVTNVAREAMVPAAETVTVEGINDAAPISITGSGMFKINDSEFTTEAATVVAGDTVMVQVMAAAMFSTEVSATLTIGTESASFAVATEAQDIAPDAFSFAPLDNQLRNTIVEAAETVVVSGINDVAAISIEGGLYSVNGGDFTELAGTVNSGDEVRVSVNTSETFNTAAQATLTIGSESAAFAATTELNFIAADISTTLENAVRGEPAVSEELIIEGFAVDTIPVTILDGQYSLASADGPFTSEPFDAMAGQSIWVQGTANAEFGGEAVVTLKLGGRPESRVSVITFVSEVDEEDPTAEIHFPPKVSLTADDSILVRGIASDDFDVAQVFVNGELATPTGPDGDNDFSTWEMADVALQDNENVITVSVVDSVDKEVQEADSVTVTKGDVTQTFPAGNSSALLNSGSIFIDEERSRLVTLDRPNGTIAIVDLNSSLATELVDTDTSNEDIDLADIRDMTYHEGEGTYIAVSLDSETFWEINPDSGDRQILVVGPSLGGDDNPTPRFLTIEYDGVRNGLALVDFNLNTAAGGIRLFSVEQKSATTLRVDPDFSFLGMAIDQATGEYALTANSSQMVFYDSEMNVTTPLPLMSLDGSSIPLSSSLAWDYEREVAYWTPERDVELYKINMLTGEYWVLSTAIIPRVETINAIKYIAFDQAKNVIYARADGGIEAVDGETGLRVMLTRYIEQDNNND